MMEFRQAENKFKQLKAQFEAGTLSEPEFKSQLEELMVQDEQGSWWMIGYETERWYRHDGTNWVQADPPADFAQDAALRERAEHEAAERAAREKTEREAAEKAAREKVEREATDTLTREQIIQKPESKIEIITPLEETKGKTVEEKSNGDIYHQNIFQEIRQRIMERSTWRFGRQEIVATIVGVILLSILGLLFARNRGPYSSLFYGPPFGTVFDPRNALLLFFSLLFGPIVGFAIGFLGSGLDSFPIPGLIGFSYFSYYARYGRVWIPILIWLLRGLMGTIMGLAKLPLSELISNRDFLRTGLFVLLAFIPNIFISIFGAGPPPNYPISIFISEWFRLRIGSMITELVFTFIYLSIFIYAYYQISKFIPGIVPVSYSKIEKTAREDGRSTADDRAAHFTEPKLQKSDIGKKRTLQSRWRRSLLGAGLGLILGIMIADYYGLGPMLIIVVVCGLAGLITYPHKLSIVFLVLGFLVAGFIVSPDLYYPEEFILGAGLFGIPAGALLSRILHWAKVLK